MPASHLARSRRRTLRALAQARVLALPAEQGCHVVLASDGVWEFLTNQSVADMILKFTDPLDACRAVVAESYRLWLQYEVRTDDITMILAFVDNANNAASTSPDEESTARNRRQSRRGSADQISIGLDVVGRAGGENRPVRRGLSKEKKQQMAIAVSTAAEEEVCCARARTRD